MATTRRGHYEERWQRHDGYPEAAKESLCPQQLEEQVRLLQLQNARLRQQQLHLETEVKEQTIQLRQQHDEEMSQRVARHARDMAGVVMQHEEEMRRLSQRYENQLALLGPSSGLPCLPRSGQGRPLASDPPLGKASALRRALTCEETKLGAASKSESDAEVARYKRKAQKLKAKRGEELRNIRGKICQGVASVAEREEAAWLCVILRAWRTQADRAVDAKEPTPWPLLLAGEGPWVLSAALTRDPLTALAALRAWYAALSLSRHEAELRTQQDKAMSRSTAALAMLRNETRALRCQGRRAAMRASQRWALLTTARPFAAWKDATKEALHAMRFQTRLAETDHSSTAALRTARAEVQAFRRAGRKRAELAAQRQGLLSCAQVLSAWRRQVDSGKTSRRLRPGEVLLNSGEAAKRAQQQLTEVRVQSSEQLNALEKENAELKKEASNARMAAAAAARREARVDNISRRHEHAAKRGEELAALLACMKAWVGEVVLARSTEALRKEASERLAESLARVRLESRGALHRAWSEAAEASRKAAALERRLEGLDAVSPTGPVEITRLDGFDGSRPNTAAAIERRLEEADERARRRLSTARSVASEPREALGESLAAEDAPTILGAAEVLQLSLPTESCVQTDFPDDALAARESRKLLFTAALGEQARDCQGRALDGWRRVILQDRCARLEALLSLRHEKAASKTATPRSTSKSSVRSPRPPLAR